MTDNQPSNPPLDGIASPEDSPAVAPTTQSIAPDTVVSPPLQKGIARALIAFFIFVAVAYIVPGLVLMAIFPRPDGQYENLKNFAMSFYPFGGVIWALFALVAGMRIASIKDMPRRKFFAGIRLGLYILPLLLVSIITPLIIRIPPTLYVEILSPKSPSDLVAPVSVTFGMPVALKYFEVNRLTPLKFEWDFNGDGRIDQESFESQSVFLFDRSGIYSTACKVTMTDGQVKRLYSRTVIPRASFSVLPTQPVIEEPVTFTLTHLLPKTENAPKLSKAKWDFDGDGTIDLETDTLDATTTYHRLGPVTVSATLLLSNQTQTSYQRTLEVVKPQEQPFPITLETEPSTLLGPPPFGVLFTLKTKEPIANAAWDFGNQKNAEGLRVAQVFNAVGTYTVSVVARSQSGSVARFSKVIRVTNPLSIPDLVFEGTPQVRNFTIEGQVPLSIDITPVTSQPLIAFSWDAPHSTEVTLTDTKFHALYRDEGTYFADLIGIDPEQNVFRKRLKIIALPPQSLVNFSMDPETPTAPALVKFDGSDTFVPNEEITGFEWDFSDKGSSESKFSGARMEHLFENPGTYVITLKVRTISGKEFSSNKTLLVRAPLIDACFIPSRRTGKVPLGVRFETDCSTGQFESWIWNFGDDSESDQKNPTHVFLQPGEYKVTLTATTKDGLKSTKNTMITVTQ